MCKQERQGVFKAVLLGCESDHRNSIHKFTKSIPVMMDANPSSGLPEPIFSGGIGGGTEPDGIGPGRSTRCAALWERVMRARQVRDFERTRLLEVIDEIFRLRHLRSNNSPGVPLPFGTRDPCAAVQDANDRIQVPRDPSDQWREWYRGRIDLYQNCVRYQQGNPPLGGTATSAEAGRPEYERAIDNAIEMATARRDSIEQALSRADHQVSVTEAEYRHSCGGLF